MRIVTVRDRTHLDFVGVLHTGFHRHLKFKMACFLHLSTDQAAAGSRPSEVDIPRLKIKPEFTVEALRILDRNGTVDKALLPDIAPERLREFHAAMLRARRFDERLLSLQRQGEIGTFAPVKGQEASQVGSVACLKQEDWMVPAFRETAAMLFRGTPMSSILLFNAGYNEGAAIPEDRRDLPIAVPVASQLPHAAGLAYAAKVMEDPVVVMTYFGDGATSEGDFHEALNFAAVFQLPVVFICQNNQWAISVPRDRQTRSRTLAQKALAYGMPGTEVDGNDVLAVYEASSQATERARSGEGPSLIECLTYRMEVHTTADDPSKYRDEEEVEEWAERDPIERLQIYLRDQGELRDEDIDSLEKKIEEEIEEAWKTARETIEELDDPLVMFDHIYAELPPYVQKQREWLSSYLTEASE